MNPEEKPNTFIIRTARKEDLKEIIELWIETIIFHAELDDDFTLDKDGAKNFELVLANAINDSTQVLLIATEQDEMIGFLYGYLKKYEGFFKKRTIAHISDIAVKEHYRRRGLGTALMERFENDFSMKNTSDDLSLFVHIKNDAGVKFYKDLGYDITLLTMKKTCKSRE